MRSLRGGGGVASSARRRSELANAIDRDDVDAFQGRMMEMRTRGGDASETDGGIGAHERRIRSASAQRKIEERIRRENVEHNLALAMDETPEVFARW